MPWMKRILAIDYGKKRVGIAISDPLGIFAQGLDVLYIRGKSDFLGKIAKYFNSYELEKVILGNPLNKEGEDSKTSSDFKKVMELISRHYKVEVILWDERFTTKEAKRNIERYPRKGAKKNIDKISAQLILQSYLEVLRNERVS